MRSRNGTIVLFVLLSGQLVILNYTPLYDAQVSYTVGTDVRTVSWNMPQIDPLQMGSRMGNKLC
jgi:hypothetical protein